MSEAMGEVEIVAAPAGGWCDPVAGVCHIDTDDEAATVEVSDENAAGEMPDAAK
jgi:hypothetical protein